MRKIRLVIGNANTTEEVLQKALEDRFEPLSKGKALPEGTEREWHGVKYKKQDGKWRPVAHPLNTNTSERREVSKHGRTKDAQGFARGDTVVIVPSGKDSFRIMKPSGFALHRGDFTTEEQAKQAAIKLGFKIKGKKKEKGKDRGEDLRNKSERTVRDLARKYDIPTKGKPYNDLVEDIEKHEKKGSQETEKNGDKDFKAVQAMIKEGDNNYEDLDPDMELPIIKKFVKEGKLKWEGKGENKKFVLSDSNKQENDSAVKMNKDWNLPQEITDAIDTSPYAAEVFADAGSELLRDQGVDEFSTHDAIRAALDSISGNKEVKNPANALDLLGFDSETDLPEIEKELKKKGKK